MDRQKIEEVLQHMKEEHDIDVQLIEEQYKSGYFAKNTYNPKNPSEPTVTYTDVATTEDVIHELCHCILANEGYPRVQTFNQNEALILSHLESVIEHGRVVKLGESFGVNLKVDSRQMSKLENRLVTDKRFLSDEVEAIFFADMTIRCSNSEWWEKMQKFYEENLPKVFKLGKKILKEVANFEGCNNAENAKTCHRMLIQMLKVKSCQYIN